MWADVVRMKIFLYVVFFTAATFPSPHISPSPHLTKSLRITTRCAKIASFYSVTLCPHSMSSVDVSLKSPKRSQSSSTQRADRHKVTALKGIAILAVVGTHILTSLPAKIFTQEPANTLFIILDQLGRFSVPLFVALSGFGFASKYQETAAPWLSFLVNQSKKLLPLYLWWSFTFFAVFYFLPWWRAAADLGPWWGQLLLGRADYHLYFIPMIFQLYALFPVLLWVAKKVPSLLLVSLALIFQVALYYWYGLVVSGEVTQPWFISDQHQYILSISWISYFILGIVMALHPQTMVKVARPVKKYGWIVLIITGTALSYRAVSLIQNGLDPLYALRFTKPLVIPYALSVIGAVVLVRVWWERLTHVFSGTLAGALVQIGKWSFVIYLAHTLVLRIFFSTIEKTASFPEIGIATLGLVIGLIGSWAILKKA